MKKKLHSFIAGYYQYFALYSNKPSRINKLIGTSILCFALLFNVAVVNSQTDIAVNGGFESGDFTGWTQFSSGSQSIIMTNPSEGSNCAQLNNNVPASASIIKNANVGVGTAVPNQNVTVSFDARGTLADGGVAFAELFSEISGGGVSKSQILGGAPLALNADPNVWKSFSFPTTLGPDVSGGITLQLTATTGGAGTSLANMFYDNVKITLTAPPAPTCSDGIQNQGETGIDCGGPCTACIVDPTEGPGNNSSSGTDFYIYSELGANSASSSDFAGFNLVDFSNGGIVISQPVLDGDKVLKVENLQFFGSGFGENFNATATYAYVHLNYYATSSVTGFNFSLVDNSLSATVCCGSTEEPFYKFGPSGDAELVKGSWQSVFIPLSHFANYPQLVSGTWDGTDLKQTLFTGNGTVYIDNIYFSTTNVLSTENNELSRFSTYPNPTQDSWNIKTQNINISTISVYDILGKNVLSIQPNSNEATIDGSALKSGLYFAQIKTANGISSIKLVKQ